MSGSNRSPLVKLPTAPQAVERRPLCTASRVLLALVLLALIPPSLGCGGDLDSRMAEVRALQDVGQFTESLDQLREILAIAPDLPEANYRMGVALVQTGEPSRAVWALQKASESDEYAIVAGLLLANAHLNIKNHEEAIRAADRVLERDPDRQAALQIRSRALLGVRRLEDAIADSRRLVELAPDDLTNRVVLATALMEAGHMEEAKVAHDVVKEMGSKSDDPEVAARSCLAPALYAKDGLKDKELTEKLYDECLEKYPTDAFLLSHITGFLDANGKRERSTELVRKAVDLAPENLSLRSSLANRLAANGDREGAEAVLVEAAETFGSATAWNMLATFYRRQKNPEKALEAVDKVIELTGGGGDQLRFTKADLLIDLERYDEAQSVVASLDEPVYATLIEGRILLQKGDSEGALKAFDKGIRHWPNNPGARYLAGLAARDLGDTDRAITELRESVRADARATDAAYVLSQLYLDRGEYEQASNFAAVASRGRSERPNPGAFIVGARAFAALGKYDEAERVIERLGKLEGAQTDAVIEMAGLERTRSGPAAAVTAMRESDLDLTVKENEPALRVLVDDLSAVDRDSEAIAEVDAALRADPERSSLHALRGNLLTRADRLDEARSAFERAAELDPDSAEAVAGFATLEGRAGNLTKAVELFDRAAELDPNTPQFSYSAAQLTLQQGKRDEAEVRLREVVRSFPGEADPRNDLAWILSEKGEDLDVALSLAEDASRIKPTAGILDTLGWVQLKRGDAAAAVATFERALEKEPDSASIQYRLGTALSQAGQVERARETLRTALQAGAFPEAEAAKNQLAQLEKP